MRAPRVPRTRPRPSQSTPHRTRGRAHARTASVVVVTALLGSVGVSPALAELADVATASVNWRFVDDAYGIIGDAAAHDNPANLTGWTSDAFDRFGQLRVTEPGSGLSWDFVADRRAHTIIDGETAEWVLTGSPVWAGFDYDVTLTLSLQGNSARWAYAITGGAVAPEPPEPGLEGSGETEPGVEPIAPAPEPAPAPTSDAGLTVRFGGELGSDAESRYTVNGTTLMSDDGGGGDLNATDPVLGYAVTTDGDFTGWDAVAGTDTPRAGATGVTTFTVDLVYADYNSCGFPAAQGLVTSLLPTLPARFGAVYPATGDCLAFDPVTLELGVAVDQVLAFQVDPRLALDDFFLDPIEVVVDGLPAGLDYAAEQDPTDGAIMIHLVGTPTELGEFTASTMFAVPGVIGNQRAAVTPPGATPVYGSIAFRIVPAAAVVVPPPATPSATPAPTPPPTPTDASTPPPVDPATTPLTPITLPSDGSASSATSGSSVKPVVTPTATLVTALPTPRAAAASTVRALPTTGIDLGRSLGFGLLAILGGALALTALALRSYARVVRGERP
ncbi:hypothetical protein [Cryobacterium melibiosiphilum]|uniref:hypothetical protein n=1 Tax=Cryobacterium melibiosiphilum TaxID=995039 RepID=UPI001314D51D|nr:hypothetical protein [Cryobacterium melibiosiphilum]